jgi:CubicO group peptidase (beta-lactamase class C family)
MPAMQGLGWRLSDWDGVRVIGHGGGTIGQISFLQAIPERDLVVVLLTNSPTPTGLWHDLGGWLFETLAGVRMPRVPRPDGPVPDLLPLDHYAGRYERLGARFDITIEDGSLIFRTEPTDVLADIQTVPSSPPRRLQPVDRETFYLADADGDSLITFHEFTNGRPAYLHTGRANPRTASALPPR